MKLLMYGVNKETVMKEDTIKYFLDDQKKAKQMKDISTFDGVEEIAILTTDFRNEYYLYVDELTFSHGEFLRYLAEQTNKSLQELILETYSKFNEDVLRHVFEVTSGYLSDPKGSFEVLESIEIALRFAVALNTIDKVISRMFQSAIYLAYDMKLEDLTKPLNRTFLSSYIYLLKERMNGLEKKNYLISGTDFEVYFLTRILLFAQASTITIIHSDEEKTQRQFAKATETLNDIERSKVYPATSKSLYYRLSKIDAAILDMNQINLFSKEISEEVAVIRQTKKVQYIVDTSDNAISEQAYPNLDLQLINGHSVLSFTDEEQANAVVVFEEKLSIHIKQFMEFLENIQVNKMKEQLLN